MKHRTGWSPDDGDDPLTSDIPPPSGDEQISTTDMIHLLVVQARDYAATEVERQRLRARLLGAAGRDAAILALVAVFLLSGALVALLVGCILVLAPLIGTLPATLVVVGVALVLIATLVLIAIARVRSAMRSAFAKAEQP